MDADMEPMAGATRWIRVWFGHFVIADYVAEPATALRYEQAMRRRFLGLLVTNDDLAKAGDNCGRGASGLRPLPGESLWDLTP
jgi:hypothetical protein